MKGIRPKVRTDASDAVSSIPLYPSEERIIQALFGQDVPRNFAETWDGVAVMLEREGLPKRDPLFGNRRYRPAVEEFLRQRNGLTSNKRGFAPDGEENWP